MQWCSSIHHITGYSSTLYRLTRNLSTTMIYHLARDLDVSRKLSCVLLNLTNKTFSCNAYCIVSFYHCFFLKRNNFSQNHFHFLSLDIQKIFLRCNPLSLSLPYVGIRPDCPAWEQLSSVFGLVLRRRKPHYQLVLRLVLYLYWGERKPHYHQQKDCPSTNLAVQWSVHVTKQEAEKVDIAVLGKLGEKVFLIEQQYQVLAVNVAYFRAVCVL